MYDLAGGIGKMVFLIFTGRLRGLGFALLHAIGLFGVALLAFLLAGYLIYGNAWFGRFQ